MHDRPIAAPLRLVADHLYTLALVDGGAIAYLGWTLRALSAARVPPTPSLWAAFAVAVAIGVALGVTAWRRWTGIAAERHLRDVEEHALELLRETRRARRRLGHRIDATRSAALEAAGAALERELSRSARRDDGPATAAAAIDAAAEALAATIDESLHALGGAGRRSAARQYATSLAWMLLVALLLRSFVAEAYYIPSGSMIPTFQVGDHIFINKFIYGLRIPGTDIKIGMGLRAPRRGEVIVFKHPRHPDTDLVKRIVGLPGDTVEIRANQLYINGQPAPRVHQDGPACGYEDRPSEASDRWEHRTCDAFTERLGSHEFTTLYEPGLGPRSWGPEVVPAGNVFVMGDNRDNSNDSRYWGTVPYELIRGKAMIIWWSSGQPEGIRVARMGHLVE